MTFSKFQGYLSFYFYYHVESPPPPPPRSYSTLPRTYLYNTETENDTRTLHRYNFIEVMQYALQVAAI